MSACSALLLMVTMAVASPPAPSPEGGAELLARASDATNLRAEGARPFRMRAAFWIVEPGHGRPSGRYELAWRDAKNWRETIDYAGHRRLAGQDGGTAWVSTAAPYDSLQILDVMNALDISSKAALQDGSAIDSIKEAARSKDSAIDFHLKQTGRFYWAEIRLERASGLLIRHETGASQANGAYRATHEYTDYRDAVGRRFPWVIKRFDGKREVLEVHIEEISDLAADAPLVAKPADAFDRSLCAAAESSAAVECKVTKPDYGSMVRTGSMAARAVVGRDGRVHDITIVDAYDFNSSGELIRYLESWRCKPLTCGGVPVDAEIFEQIAFAPH